METDLKSVLSRSAPRLVQDLLGVTSLVVMLFVGLHLPLLM